MWADVATDLTSDEITKTAFGVTIDEIHQLEGEFNVHSIDAELTPYCFGQATVYSMTQVLDEVKANEIINFKLDPKATCQEEWMKRSEGSV
ncbi:hypothetical protein ARMGADRAFT_1075083 [Armillaria gallica]|uniref:Uncharacterized protein n=1 Tax=Armillaria gallica TaxID=47427 RepID=A0A2H3E3D9_ARMGA|nr:hypothetical protein ARMGADRAFT_1075083 [Armillaria gallica]